MKANIETTEPVIRPVAAKPAATVVRSPVRPFALMATMAQPVLFHAWRA